MLIDEVSNDVLDAEACGMLRSWGLESLTQVQVQALKAGVSRGQSAVVCAPTSSGKTLVGELTILSALKRGSNCLYLVSHKALADQKYADFEERFGDAATHPLASVGLSTGDRNEGEVSPRLLVATYEKALALLLSGQINVNALVVVADELQIIGEVGRGPNIETLCTILKQRGVEQFVALTATVGNPAEMADWLECKLVNCGHRDVDLHQEVWFGGQAYGVIFGQDTGEVRHGGTRLPGDAIEVTRHLVRGGRGPVLVFTESRREASDYAERYSQSQVRTADGIVVSEQLELFSEPTESSQQLQNNAQRRVAFHTADLTAQERQVIERGFDASSFDVCFATSTLAAGVNFPFRSVVFPKLTYEFGERAGHMIGRAEYRNMSGRAGRLGFHAEGFAVLLPKNARENSHANALILPDNENLDSKLVSLSMRRTVLALISSQVVTDRGQLQTFFQHTFYWHQIRERNPKKLDDVVDSAAESLDWLIGQKLVDVDGEFLLPTPVGRAVAQSGLLPSTAVSFVELVNNYAGDIDNDFDKYVPGLIHWVCQCDEFRSNWPSRFLPFPSKGVTSSTGFLQASGLLASMNRTDAQVIQSAHALVLFCRGEGERTIRHQTNITSGQLHRLAIDVAWVFDGLRRIISVPDLGYPQTLTNKLTMLARQVQWGAPVEALDILRVAQREGVPGFGRQRAVALLKRGISTFDQLLGQTKEVLASLLGNDRRASSLLSAVASCVGLGVDRYKQAHLELATKLGMQDAFLSCEDRFGTEYEDAIRVMLEHEKSWSVHVLDDGTQQNVPDLMIRLDKTAVIIECKTTTKNPPLIKKEDAFAVVQKASDYDPAIARITLGKPSFDEHSKKKAQGSPGLALVEHSLFMEGVLRLHAGEITADEFLKWISAPGVAELDRLGGKPSYQIVRDGGTPVRG